MKKLTAYNNQNDREISMMMGKAMCSYANWQQERNSDRENKTQKALIEQSHRSEYEATVRCIDMFVKESIYEIQQAIIDSCKEEFGI